MISVMREIKHLTSLFLGQRGEATGAPSRDLEQSLERILGAARAAWPEIDLPAAVFVRHVAAHWPEQADAVAYLSAVHAADLYLACACGQGIPSAIATFERVIISSVPQLLLRLSPSPALVDEVRQQLREKLLLAEGTAPPKILKYAGSGTLAAWVRVVAQRAAIDKQRAGKQGVTQPLDGATLQALTESPELSHLRASYQKELLTALHEAFGSLPREQRNVLRLHFVGGLSGEKIAAMLAVNRSTVVRWLAAARSALMRQTRRLLTQRLRLPDSELDSMIRILRSQLDVSLSTLLRTASE